MPTRMPTSTALEPDPLRTALGRALKDAREARGIGGRQLAAGIGLSPNAAQVRWSRAENGLGPIDLDEAVRFAHGVGTTLREVLVAAKVDGEVTSTLELAIRSDPTVSARDKAVLLVTVEAMRAQSASAVRGGGAQSTDEVLAGLLALAPDNRQTVLDAATVRATADAVAARRRQRNGKRGA